MADDSGKAELNLIHIGQRPEGFDIEHFAYEELESAKESLREDGYLPALAWVVAAADIHVFALGFHGPDQKHEVYGQLVGRARDVRAEAIITLNDTRYLDRPDDVDYYPGMTSYPGHISFEGAKEAVTVTISGPQIASKKLTATYERVGDKVVFGPTEEMSDVTVGMLGSWSKEVKGVQ